MHFTYSNCQIVHTPNQCLSKTNSPTGLPSDPHSTYGGQATQDWRGLRHYSDAIYGMWFVPKPHKKKKTALGVRFHTHLYNSFAKPRN